MALSLVVTTPFQQYPRGTILTDPATVSAVRLSEYASAVVLVSDTLIPPPEPPPPALDLSELQAAYAALEALVGQQQAALSAAEALNVLQSQGLNTQAQQINALTALVNQLASKIENPGGGPAIPPNLADDLPLAEDDGVVLSTDTGRVLVGDRR